MPTDNRNENTFSARLSENRAEGGFSSACVYKKMGEGVDYLLCEQREFRGAVPAR